MLGELFNPYDLCYDLGGAELRLIGVIPINKCNYGQAF